MHYLYYMLAVLLLGLGCLAAIRLFAKNQTKRATAIKDEQRLATLGAKLIGKKPRSKPAPLKHALPPVRTPWGWPNHQANNGGQTWNEDMSGALKALTNRLVREKKLVGSGSTNPRINNSLRALLEDRYGPVNKDTMATVEYAKVKRPLLRDPSEAHDQMDNFGVQEAERVRARLDRMKAMKANESKASKEEETRYVEMKDIKQPWGW